MCNSKIKSARPASTVGLAIDGRQVLQPAGNRVACTLEVPLPLKQSPITNKNLSPKPQPIKRRGHDPNSLNSSTEKPITPKPMRTVLVAKKSEPMGFKNLSPNTCEVLLLAVDRVPGSIAAAHREQASLALVKRKTKIAHYGRVSNSSTAKPEKAAALPGNQEEKRCSFITPNSDPLYVAYHDEEWGVPVHDDNMLFELLVLSGLQVGLDWTTILKKRNEFRSAFAGFDADLVASFTERQIGAISRDYGVDLSKVRGVVDNSNQILEVRKGFGSFDKYLWGFVNHKPISTNYKIGRKIPVKTSKSESISKDMVRRGFRFVGPTVVHSFMQAAGLTNDHLLCCPCHLHCSTLH